MTMTITPDELPRWVPGESTLDTATRPGWAGIRLRGFRYAPSDVWVPPMDTYLLVAYRAGETAMSRRCRRGAWWQNGRLAPGDVSLLTRAVSCCWNWSARIEVLHLYLSRETLAEAACEVHGRGVREVEFRDVLRAIDPVLLMIVETLAREAREEMLGGRLYVDSLRSQLCLHLLRHYADVTFREAASGGALSAGQCRLLTRYVDDNIEANLSLGELAGVVQMSAFSLLRRFRKEFGCPPHVYVLRRRVEHAKRRIACRDSALKAVAAQCGFSDQSHMTRVFRRLVGVTPAEYRRGAPSGSRLAPG